MFNQYQSINPEKQRMESLKRILTNVRDTQEHVQKNGKDARFVRLNVKEFQETTSVLRVQWNFGDPRTTKSSMIPWNFGESWWRTSRITNNSREYYVGGCTRYKFASIPHIEFVDEFKDVGSKAILFPVLTKVFKELVQVSNVRILIIHNTSKFNVKFSSI